MSHFNPFQDVLERIEKRTAYGIVPKNAEQTFAMHAILNPNIRLVSIQGVAGTGKTLLALSRCFGAEKGLPANSDSQASYSIGKQRYRLFAWGYQG